MSDYDTTIAVLVFYIHLMAYRGDARGKRWFQNMLCACRAYLSRHMGLSFQQVQETAEWLAAKSEVN